MQAAHHRLHARIEETHWWFVARRRIVAAVVRRAVPTGATVVDVGCGTGATLGALAGDYRCVGVDASAEALALARARFPAVLFQPAPLRPETAAQADLVILADVLEHVADDAMLLARIVRDLRPTAQILVTVPANPSLWSPHDESFGHLRRYTPETLADLWKGLPVAVRLFADLNVRLCPIVRLVRAAARLRGHAAGEAGTDFRMPPRWINAILARTFGGEMTRILSHIDIPGAAPRGRGTSLIALLARGEPSA